LLADPNKHWETGHSAKALACCWEHAEGLPKEIADILRTDENKPELLLAIPEHKVQLRGSSLGASQNDLFALIRVGFRTIAVTVEGKVAHLSPHSCQKARNRNEINMLRLGRNSSLTR